MAWSEDTGDAALQNGDWEALQRAVLLALPCWLGAQQHPAEPSRSAVSLTFCCVFAPLPIALVYRHMWKKCSTRAECCDNSSCWPRLASTCAPVTHLNPFTAQRGPRLPCRDVCYSGWSPSPLTHFAKLLNLRGSGVWFLYQGLAEVVFSCLSS